MFSFSMPSRPFRIIRGGRVGCVGLAYIFTLKGILPGSYSLGSYVPQTHRFFQHFLYYKQPADINGGIPHKLDYWPQSTMALKGSGVFLAG